MLLVFYVACYFIRQFPIPFVSNHIMNFALSGGILVVTIFPDIAGKGISKLSLLLAATFWAMVNIIFELFIEVDVVKLPGVDFVNFNTPDPIDAVYGLLGIGVFLFTALRYGVAVKSSKKSQAK